MPVDLQEKRQLDGAGRMGRAGPNARPWRAIIAGALAVVAAFAAFAAHGEFGRWTAPGHLTGKLVTLAASGAFCLLGIAAVAGFSRKAREILQPVTGSAHAAVVRYTIMLAGGVTVFVITLAVLKVPVGQLVLGGAITTVLLGIAAQQTLSNVFAGLVLLMSRPFMVGDDIVIRSGALGGQVEGTVTEIGIYYLRLESGSGALRLPNAQVLAAVAGPAQPAGPGAGAAAPSIPPESGPSTA